MARQEHDREDLLREATALVERIEFTRSDDRQESVVVGFRRDGCASIYFGADPAFHFNSRGELRRAFVGGQLVKAQKRRLVAMRRERSAGEVQLRSRPLAGADTQSLLDDIRRRLAALDRDLAAGHYTIRGAIPPNARVAERACEWLAARSEIAIAPGPHAR